MLPGSSETLTYCKHLSVLFVANPGVVSVSGEVVTPQWVNMFDTPFTHEPALYRGKWAFMCSCHLSLENQNMNINGCTCSLMIKVTDTVTVWVFVYTRTVFSRQENGWGGVFVLLWLHCCVNCEEHFHLLKSVIIIWRLKFTFLNCTYMWAFL